MKIARFRIILLTIIAAAALLMVACTSGTTTSSNRTPPSAPSAVDAVKSFFDALYTRSDDPLAYVCSDTDVADAYFGAATAAMQGAPADPSGLTYRLIRQAATTAIVEVSGQIVYTVSGADTPARFSPALIRAVRENDIWKFCGTVILPAPT
jgi:hypothetical protein